MREKEAREAAIAWFDSDVRSTFIEYFDKAIASGAVDSEDVNWMEIRSVLLIAAENYQSNLTPQKKIAKNLRCFL